MVNLTTVAPDIVAAILDEMLSPEVTLFELAVEAPAVWEEQRGCAAPFAGLHSNDLLTTLP